MMQRHSILAGKCYRDRLGAIYRVVGFDGNGRNAFYIIARTKAASTNESIPRAGPTFLRTFKGRSNVPFPRSR